MIDIRTHIFARTFGQCLKLMNPYFINSDMKKGDRDPSIFAETFPPSQYVKMMEISGNKRVNKDRLILESGDDGYSDGYGENGGTIDYTQDIMMGDLDKEALQNARIMNAVKIADVNILNIENNPYDNETTIEPPALLIDFGADELMEEGESADVNASNQAMMIIIRLVMGRAIAPYRFLESNAVRTSAIKDALDYLLDPQMFRTYAGQTITQDGQEMTVISNRVGFEKVTSRSQNAYIKRSNNLGAVRDKYITDFIFIVEFFQQKERGQYAVQDNQLEDSGKDTVVIQPHKDINRKLNIPTKAQTKSIIKKRALFVYTVLTEDGEEFDFVLKRLLPTETAEVFGSLFGKTSVSARKKLVDGEDEEAIRSELEETLADDEDSLSEMIDQINEAVHKTIVFPEDFEIEDVDDLDEGIKDDIFSFGTKGVMGSGDSVDSFPDVVGGEGENLEQVMMLDWYCRRYKLAPADEVAAEVDCWHSRIAINLHVGLVAQTEQNRIEKLAEDKRKSDEELESMSNNPYMNQRR